MTNTNKRDLENRFDDLRGDDESGDEELDEVEQWRAFIESATDDGDREDPADDE